MTLGFVIKSQIMPMLKEKINKFDYIKIKNFCSSKNAIKRVRMQISEWGVCKGHNCQWISTQIIKNLHISKTNAIKILNGQQT